MMLGDAEGLRACDLSHAVDDTDANGDLGTLRTGAARPDFGLVSTAVAAMDTPIAGVTVERPAALKMTGTMLARLTPTRANPTQALRTFGKPSTRAEPGCRDKTTECPSTDTGRRVHANVQTSAKFSSGSGHCGGAGRDGRSGSSTEVRCGSGSVELSIDLPLTTHRSTAR
jgi:hypothetical protein